jgi:hypothetical protein
MNERHDDVLTALRNANPHPAQGTGSHAQRVDEILSHISTTRDAEESPPGPMTAMDDQNVRPWSFGRSAAFAALIVLVAAVTLVLLLSGGLEGEVADSPTTLTTIGQGATSIPAPSTTSAVGVYPGDSLRLGGFSGYSVDGWQGVLWIENESSQTIVIDSGEFVLQSDTGTVIETRPFSQRILYPGVNYFDVVGSVSPELIEVRYHEAEFMDAGRFTVSDLSFETSPFVISGPPSDGIDEIVTQFTVSGEITSSFNQHRDGPELLLVYFDADGKPLFASGEALRGHRVAPGTSSFEETLGLGYDEMLKQAPAWAHIEAFAHPAVWDPSPRRNRIGLTRSLSSTVEAPGEYPGDSLRFGGFSGYRYEGISVVTNEAWGYWQGVVWVENESSETIVIDSGELVYRSATGAIIDTDSFSQRILYPGVNYISVGLSNPEATPESIEVSYHEARFFDAGRFTTSDVAFGVPAGLDTCDGSMGSGTGCNPSVEDVTTVAFQSVDVEFNIAHDFSDDKEPEFLFVFFDADGNPLFAQWAESPAVAPSGNERLYWGFNIGRPLVWDHVEVHAHPSLWDPSPSRDRIESTRRVAQTG